MNVISVIEQNKVGQEPVWDVYIKIKERVEAMEEPQAEDFDLSDPEQVKIWKTCQVLLNKVIYANGYLEQ